MNKSELIVGLDIGTTKICAVVGELSESGLVDVVGIGTSVSTGLRKGVVVNIEQTVQSIRKAVEDAELMAGCEIHSVYVGIAGSHIMGINSHGVIAVKGGEVAQRDIERALDAARAVAIPADREVIHILPQEYIVDNQRGIADPLGMAGVRLEVKVHIVTGAVSSAQNIVRSCHRSQLEVADIALESLASAKAVLTEEEREIGVALVDLGGGTTDIAVLSLGGKVKATSVRVAGNHYDEEILKFVRNKFSIAIGQRTAENLKKNVACCPQKADFNETMEIKGRSLLTGLPVRVNVSTADLYEPVMRLSEQIGTAAHQVLEKTPPELAGDIYRNGVMLTGGGAQLHGLTEYLSQELKVEVTVSPDPVNCVALGTAMSLGVRDKLETGFTDATPRIGRR